MPSISLTNPANITKLEFTSISTERLGGTVDVSAFTNLQRLVIRDHDLTEVEGYANNPNIQEMYIHGNVLSTPLPSLTEMTSLQVFSCRINQLTGFIPSLSGLGALQRFYCAINKLTGFIPSLSGLTNLEHFVAFKNQLTGSIPDLSGLGALTIFNCATNQLTDFAGGSVSNTLARFMAQDNQLTPTAINAILAAFVAAGRTIADGVCVLNLAGTGNAAPTGQGLIDKAELDSRGWEVTTNP